MLSKGRAFTWIAITSIAFVLGIVARAQDVSGRINGTLTDSTGATVPNAEISATNQQTGVVSHATSDAHGAYGFESLAPGTYTITCVVPGFRRFSSTGNVVSAERVSTLVIHLELGQVSQSVDVGASFTQVDTVEPALQSNISEQTLMSLPVEGRDPRETVELTQPGTVSAESGHTGARVSVNGTRGANNNYQVDGTENIDYFNGNSSVYPAVENLQEFSVITNAADAEYGSSAGSQVSAIIKSGTNNLHGMGWVYLQNSGWAANSWQGNRTGTARPTAQQRWYGGNIGGPVVLPKLYNGRDKTFFFFSYEYTNPSSQVLEQQLVPTAAERTGDFSQSGSIPVINGVPTPYLNPANFSPMAKALLANTSLLPLPNGPNGQYTWLGTNSQTLSNIVGKIDQNFGSKHRVFFSAFRYHQDLLWNPLLGIQFAAPTLPNEGVSTFRTYTSTWTVNYTYTISANMLNNFIFGFRPYTVGPAASAGNPDLTWGKLGVSAVPDVGVAPTQIGIFVNGWGPNGFTLWGNYNDTTAQHNYYITDNFTWIKNRHTIKAGYYQRILHNSKLQDWEAGGAYSFSAGQPGSTGNVFADFLLGDGATFTQESTLDMKLSYPDYEAYVQDEYKATKKLTVDLGVRWTPSFAVVETRGELSAFRPGEQSQIFPNAPTGLVVPGDPGVPPATYSNRYFDFAPRVGLAYDLTGNGKMAIRAGYGIYSDYQYFLGLNDFGSSVPYGFTYSPPGPVSITDPYYGQNLFPYTKPLPGSAATKTYVFPSTPLTLYSSDPSYQNGRIHQWNVSYQWEPVNSYLFTVAYVGTRGTHLGTTQDINAPIFVPNASTDANQQARRPYPQFEDIWSEYSGANSTYNAMQLTLNKRFSKSFSVLANYTYSRAYDSGDTAGTFLTGNPTRDYYNRNLDWGPSAYDMPNSVSITYNWRLPILTNSSRWLRAAFGGWVWGGTLRAISGDPLTITSPVGFDAFSAASAWANYVGGSIYGPQTNRASQAAEWLNPAAFCAANETGPSCAVDPAAGVSYLALGDSKRGMARGPSKFFNDMQLTKNVPLFERWGTLQYTVQAFNVFNHTVLQDPDTSIGDKGTTFGAIQTAYPARSLQMALHYTF